jgi:hypothetical protein
MGLVAHMSMGERRGAYRVLVGKHEGERALERPKHRWEADMKMDLQELGWGGVDQIDLAEDRGRCQALSGFHKMQGIS